jgi:hypothetical protein
VQSTGLSTKPGVLCLHMASSAVLKYWFPVQSTVLKYFCQNTVVCHGQAGCLLPHDVVAVLQDRVVVLLLWCCCCGAAVVVLLLWCSCCGAPGDRAGVNQIN